MQPLSDHTVILIPTYNNAGTLSDVVRRALALRLPVIVVNDGSTDDTAAVLESLRDEALQVLAFPVNRGKGKALKAGFREAQRQGYQYAVTLDADGQHFPEEVPALLEAAGERTLVIGSRNLTADGMPAGNTFANRFSNFWFTVQTLRRIPDTQTGFRVYPLRTTGGIGLMTRRYEAELLLLVFSAWKGVHLAPVPIRVAYPEDRVSHFRPFWDFFRISVLNTVLCILALVYGYPRMALTALFCRRSKR